MSLQEGSSSSSDLAGSVTGEEQGSFLPFKFTVRVVRHQELHCLHLGVNAPVFVRCRTARANGFGGLRHPWQEKMPFAAPPMGNSFGKN